MLKKERYQQKSVYSHRRAHRLASCSPGVLCMGFWANTCNTQLSIY